MLIIQLVNISNSFFIIIFIKECIICGNMFIYIYLKCHFFLLSLSLHFIAAISSHQLNPTDEHRSRHRQSRQSRNATMTNEDSSLSGTPRSSTHNRTRPVPTSYAYWFNTGDNNNNMNASFMRSTYAASCRSRLSRSVERCPRACRGIFVPFSSLDITHVCAWASFYCLFIFVCVCVIAYCFCFDSKYNLILERFFLYKRIINIFFVIQLMMKHQIIQP